MGTLRGARRQGRDRLAEPLDAGEERADVVQVVAVQLLLLGRQRECRLLKAGRLFCSALRISCSSSSWARAQRGQVGAVSRAMGGGS
eukprot:scaffold1318_cov388-Prasinococcus_capsulatus_cf.AAC.85